MIDTTLATLQRELFTWDDWDQDDDGTEHFFTCTLVKPIGPYPVGFQCYSITIDDNDGTITLGELAGEEGEEVEDQATFRIHFKIGEQLK